MRMQKGKWDKVGTE